MSVRLDTQVPPARPWLTPADETAPVVASRAAAGAPNRHTLRAHAGRAEQFERCVTAYRDSRKKGTNR